MSREARPAGRARPRLAGASPPVEVRVIDPVALPGDERRVVTASYFLPVSLPASGAAGVEWFRMSVVYDRDREKESVLLSRGEEALDLAQLAHVRMGLLDRLPFPRAAGRAALADALQAIRERGTGAVSVVLDERDVAMASARDGEGAGCSHGSGEGDGAA